MDATHINQINLAVQLALAALAFITLVVFFFWGRRSEQRHEQSLAERERALAWMVRTNVKQTPGANPAKTPALVTGETVVASDKFKRFLFAWRNIIGGESKTYTRLYVRARREATLRMLEEAQRLGFNAVCNIRYDAADIGGNTARPAGQQNAMAVCMASGTAYTRE